MPAGYHKAYWLGLVTNDSSWPMFDWLDKSIPAPRSTSYEHWGTMDTGTGKLPEPNNVNLPEFCAVANASQNHGSPAAWGWADTQCKDKFVYICKVNGGFAAPQEPMPLHLTLCC